MSLVALCNICGEPAQNRAANNPSICEVSKIFYGIGFKTSDKIQEASQLRMLSHDLNLRSKKIMDDCRELMEQSDMRHKHEFDPNKEGN